MGGARPLWPLLVVLMMLWAPRTVIAQSTPAWLLLPSDQPVTCEAPAALPKKLRAAGMDTIMTVYRIGSEPMSERVDVEYDSSGGVRGMTINSSRVENGRVVIRSLIGVFASGAPSGDVFSVGTDSEPQKRLATGDELAAAKKLAEALRALRCQPLQER